MKVAYLLGAFNGSHHVDNSGLRWVPLGSIASTIAAISFCVGYLLMPYKIWKDRVKQRSKLSGLTPVVYFCFSTLSIFLVGRYLQEMGFFEGLLRGQLIGSKFFLDEDGQRSSLAFLSIGAEFSLIIFVMGVFQPFQSRTFKFYYLIMILLSMLVFLSSTQRLSMFYSMILIIIALSTGAKNFMGGKRVFAIFGGLGLLVLTTSLRSAGRDGISVSSINASVGSAFSEMFNQMFSKPYFLTLDKTGLIIDNVNTKSGFIFGESVFSIITAPIPRILWADKPAVRVGRYVAETVYDRTNSGVPPGIVAEFYMNFGWIGIVVGMFGLGLFSRMAYNKFLRDRKISLEARVFYGMFLVSFLLIALVADLNGGILRFLKMGIAFYICKRYWEYRNAKLALKYHVNGPKGELSPI